MINWLVSKTQEKISKPCDKIDNQDKGQNKQPKFDNNDFKFVCQEMSAQNPSSIQSGPGCSHQAIVTGRRKQGLYIFQVLSLNFIINCIVQYHKKGAKHETKLFGKKAINKEMST